MAKKIKQIYRLIRKKVSLKKAVVIGVVLLGILIWRIIAANKAKNGAVSTTVQKGNVAEELILSGEIKAERHAKLAFPTSGKIAWIGVSEGDRVRKWQALASLDQTTLDAAYQQARANLRKYEATVDKVHDDLKNKDTTETYTERDTRTTAEANKDYYYDALRTAEYSLKNATLIAPFDGVVILVANPFSGINITSTETQIEIIDPSTIYFEVSADQNEVISLSPNQTATIILDSFPELEPQGKIAHIGYAPKTDEAGTVYKIKIGFSGNDFVHDKLRAGMTGDAKFVLSEKENVLFVSPRFINSDKTGKYVNLGKKNNKVYVEIGIEGKDAVEITGDIKEGDVVYD